MGDGTRAGPFVIGIAGGTASGKTTVCRNITQNLSGQRVVLLCLDEFYRDLTAEEVESISEVNFDEPAAFDIPKVLECVDQLRRCEDVDVPVYDFVTSSRSLDKVRRVNAADVVIIEGILVLHLPEIRERCDMKIFIDTDDDLRLARRIKRDTLERGRDFESVIHQYTRFVKPSFDEYVLPSKAFADVIIPWREDRPVAIELITQHVRMILSRSAYERSHLDIVSGGNASSAIPGLHSRAVDQSHIVLPTLMTDPNPIHKATDFSRNGATRVGELGDRHLGARATYCSSQQVDEVKGSISNCHGPGEYEPSPPLQPNGVSVAPDSIPNGAPLDFQAASEANTAWLPAAGVVRA